MKFQPLNEILKGMGSEFIDKDCQKQCFQMAGTSYVAKKDGSLARRVLNRPGPLISMKTFLMIHDFQRVPGTGTLTK